MGGYVIWYEVRLGRCGVKVVSERCGEGCIWGRGGESVVVVEVVEGVVVGYG